MRVYRLSLEIIEYVHDQINCLLSHDDLVFIGCQYDSTEKGLESNCTEINISALDKTLNKSIPAVELILDTHQILLDSPKDTSVCLELGIHLLKIKDTINDSIYLEREFTVMKNKDLLRVWFYKPANDDDFLRQFAYWKLLDTLKEIKPSRYQNLQEIKIELFTNGQIPDSIVSQNQQIYDEILKNVERRDFSIDTNKAFQIGFNVTYHQTMRI